MMFSYDTNNLYVGYLGIVKRNGYNYSINKIDTDINNQKAYSISKQLNKVIEELSKK